MPHKLTDLFLRYFDTQNLHLDIQIRILDKSTKEPFEPGLRIRFYDKDAKDIDFLAEGVLDEKGIADVRFNPRLIHQGREDCILPFIFRETKPDLFFELLRNDKVVYTSSVIDDVDYDKTAHFSLADGKEIDMGTWLVNLK
jgi:hypothetical protein